MPSSFSPMPGIPMGRPMGLGWGAAGIMVDCGPTWLVKPGWFSLRFAVCSINEPKSNHSWSILKTHPRGLERPTFPVEKPKFSKTHKKRSLAIASKKGAFPLASFRSFARGLNLGRRGWQATFENYELAIRENIFFHHPVITEVYYTIFLMEHLDLFIFPADVFFFFHFLQMVTPFPLMEHHRCFSYLPLRASRKAVKETSALVLSVSSFFSCFVASKLKARSVSNTR